MIKTQRPGILKAILFCCLFTGLLAAFSFVTRLFPERLERFAYGIVGTIAAVLVTLLFLRIDKIKWKNSGLAVNRSTFPNFFIGFMTGFVIAASMVTSLVYTTGGTIIFVEKSNIPSFFFWALALIPLAYLEELAFRGYPFMKLMKANGIWTAQIIIAILFALYHIVGGQSIISSFLGPGVWSFVFGLGVIITGGISLSTGLHFAANLVLAAMGQHRGFGNILTIQYPGGIDPAIQEKMETLSIIIHLLLLVFATAVMYWYSKKHRTSQNQA